MSFMGGGGGGKGKSSGKDVYVPKQGYEGRSSLDAWNAQQDIKDQQSSLISSEVSSQLKTKLKKPSLMSGGMR